MGTESSKITRLSSALDYLDTPDYLAAEIMSKTAWNVR